MLVEVQIDRIIRSNRRTISIQINESAELVVRAPRHANKQAIERAILKHIGWIIKTKKLMEKRLLEAKPKKFVDGERFWFLGNLYPLKIVKTQRRNIVFKENTFFMPQRNVKKGRYVFVNWYKNKAKEVISARAEIYSKIMQISYKKIRITNATKRWGSCSHKGKSLNFSWRLIMAPLEVVDYVVVHELAHIKEDNHQKGFWNIVSKIYPPYKKCQKWLKENGHKLIV